MKRAIWKYLGILIILCLNLTACRGEKNSAEETDFSYWRVNVCYTEDGLLYHDPNTEFEGYFDYETKKYFPLCIKPECLHDSGECTSVAMKQKATMAGRLGNRWYYLAQGDNFTCAFRSCDLDGKNDREIGEFSHTFSGGSSVCPFYENSCIFSSWDPVYDKDMEWVGMTSGIYRYHFDTGEAELLCPEKTYGASGGAYEVYGLYGDQLIYVEQEETRGAVLKKMDLKTNKEEELLRADFVSVDTVEGNHAVFRMREGNIFKLSEIDLDSKKVTGIVDIAEGESVFVCWMPELKIYTVVNKTTSGSEKKFQFKTWQYTEEESILIREGGTQEYFMPTAMAEEILIGQVKGGQYEGDLLAYMDKADFLSGKNNWTVLRC